MTTSIPIGEEIMDGERKPQRERLKLL